MRCLLHFSGHSGVVQLVAQRPLEPFILVRVQAPEPFLRVNFRPIHEDIQNVCRARHILGG